MTRGKIVGLREIKGKQADFVMVSATAPQQREGIGDEADSVWVDRPMFDLAANGRKFNDLLGKPCTFFYRARSKYLDAFEIG